VLTGERNIREGTAAKLCGKAWRDHPGQGALGVPGETGVEFLKKTLGLKSTGSCSGKGISGGVGEKKHALKSQNRRCG
jgi:hypothetical protein